MKIGTTIHNNEMTLTLVTLYGTKENNVVLLVSENDCGGCHYVTARDLTQEKNGTYFWYYGHYTNNFDEAIKDLHERRLSFGL